MTDPLAFAQGRADAGHLGEASRRLLHLVEDEHADDRAGAAAAAVRLLVRLGRLEEAAAQADVARQLAGPDPIARARALGALAAACLAHGSPADTLRHTADALDHLDDTDAVPLQLDRARAHLALGDVATARAEAESTLPVAEGLHRLDATLALAEVALAAGWPDEAARTAQAVARRARRVGARHLEADALTLLGRGLLEQAAYPQAEVAYGSALTAHKATGQRGGAAACLGGIGLCRMGTAKTAEGLQLLTRAVGLCAEMGDEGAEIAWRIHLDEALMLLSRAERRQRELRRLLELAQRRGDRFREGWTERQLGRVATELKDGRAALAHHRAALAISVDRGDALAQSLDLTDLGEVQLLLDDAEAAREAWQAALAVAPDPTAPHLDAARAGLERIAAG